MHDNDSFLFTYNALQFLITDENEIISILQELITLSNFQQSSTFSIQSIRLYPNCGLFFNTPTNSNTIFNIIIVIYE